MLISPDGWCRGATRLPSPNADERPPGAKVDLLVVHNISLPPGVYGGNYVADFFTNNLDVGADPYFREIAGLRVSAHFFISREGHVVQFVPVTGRAWHAGVSAYARQQRCNDFSVGIELEGTDIDPYTEAQYAALAALSQSLMTFFPMITVERIVGHCDIAPGRKTDPGISFDWNRFLMQLGREKT